MGGILPLPATGMSSNSALKSAQDIALPSGFHSPGTGCQIQFLIKIGMGGCRWAAQSNRRLSIMLKGAQWINAKQLN
jgi:hypothetical protein